MTTFYTDAFQITFAIMLVVVVAYASGRAHQWYRHGLDRDQAFREGYNHASHALFHLAIRSNSRTAGPVQRRGE